MRGTITIAGRVLAGLRGDRPTLALVLGAPVFIIFLFAQVFDQVPPRRFNTEFIAPVLLGFFVFVLTYLLTAIGFLRERQNGTLERVLASPVSRSGLVVGYLVGFGVLATLQAAVLLGAGILFLDVEFQHGVGNFFLLEVLGALVALGIGIAVSLFAQNEFQVIQFIPLVITPQVILCGVFLPVEELPAYLEVPALVMPLTYLLKGMNYVVLGRGSQTDLTNSILILAAFALVSVVVAAAVVRRGS